MLSVPAGASWSQIVQLAQSVLSHGTLADDDLTGPLASDLFGLADAIAELIDAPVTIEDRGSRVLAYSGRQDEADAARAETIVGRRVPERFVSRLEERGAFREASRGERLRLRRRDLDEDVLPRLAVAVRAGDEMLGSIWAAMPDATRSREGASLRRDRQGRRSLSARHRAGADVERTLQAELLASILQGSAGAREASVRLGLTGPAYRVLALWLHDAADGEAGHQRTQFRMSSPSISRPSGCAERPRSWAGSCSPSSRARKTKPDPGSKRSGCPRTWYRAPARRALDRHRGARDGPRGDTEVEARGGRDDAGLLGRDPGGPSRRSNRCGFRPCWRGSRRVPSKDRDIYQDKIEPLAELRPRLGHLLHRGATRVLRQFRRLHGRSCTASRPSEHPPVPAQTGPGDRSGSSR